jgi:anti-anti-sigma factor
VKGVPEVFENRVISKFVTKEGVTIFRIQGKLILSTVEILRKNLENLLQKEGSKIILNLGEVTVLDSPARDVLAEMAKEAVGKGSVLCFAEMPPAAGRLVNLPELKGVIQRFKTEEEALESLTK